MRLALDLPMPPSVNKAYATTRGGRRILTQAGKDYKRRVATAVAAHCASSPDLVFQETPLSLKICIYTETENKGWSKGKAKNRYKRLDASNRVKLLEDAVFSVLGVDDCLVFNLQVQKIRHTTTPYVSIELTEWKTET